jgi:hypothetical protein
MDFLHWETGTKHMRFLLRVQRLVGVHKRSLRPQQFSLITFDFQSKAGRSLSSGFALNKHNIQISCSQSKQTNTKRGFR